MVGVLTDRDIVVRAIAESRDPQLTYVREVMTSEPFFLSQDQSVEAAALAMQDKRIRRLLVQDDQGDLVGIVSLGDLAAEAHRSELSGKTLEEVCSRHSHPVER